MTSQLKAVLMIANHPVMAGILLPIIDPEGEQIHWNRIRKGLSGGERAAAAWAWCIWNDMSIPQEEQDENPDWDISIEGGWRDPFEGFAIMSPSLQLVCVQALLYRHGNSKGLRMERVLTDLGTSAAASMAAEGHEDG